MIPRPKKGQYFYSHSSWGYGIYRYDEVTETSTYASPVDTTIYTREEARRKVYALNGWSDKPRNNGKNTPPSSAR